MHYIRQLTWGRVGICTYTYMCVYARASKCPGSFSAISHGARCVRDPAHVCYWPRVAVRAALHARTHPCILYIYDRFSAGGM